MKQIVKDRSAWKADKALNERACIVAHNPAKKPLFWDNYQTPCVEGAQGKAVTTAPHCEKFLKNRPRELYLEGSGVQSLRTWP
jgi:hypothetical protein